VGDIRFLESDLSGFGRRHKRAGNGEKDIGRDLGVTLRCLPEQSLMGAQRRNIFSVI